MLSFHSAAPPSRVELQFQQGVEADVRLSSLVLVASTIEWAGRIAIRVGFVGLNMLTTAAGCVLPRRFVFSMLAIVVVSVTDLRDSHSKEIDQTTVSFGLLLDEVAPATGSVDWRVIASDPTSSAVLGCSLGSHATETCAGASSPCSGSVQIASGGHAPAANQAAVYSSELLAGTNYTIQIKPFASPGVSSAVLPPPDFSKASRKLQLADGW